MKYNPQKRHRRSIRLKGYDYSQAGAYFITICTKNRKCLFGQVVNGEMILNEMGQIAYDEWLKTPELRSNVSLDVFVIMPNHMHGIVVILDQAECDSPIPMPMPMQASPFRSPSNNIGAIARGYKSSVTKQINLLNYSGSVWHRNYHEHIIRTEQSYHLISDYIINNPKKWNDDKFYMK